MKKSLVLLASLGFLASLITTSHATDLYWGGGNVNITPPQLPATGGAATGTWDSVTQNWATDASGTSYGAWADNSVAIFGGLGASNVNLTNKTSATVYGLTYNATGIGDYNWLDDGSTRTITLAGSSSPIVKVDGSTGAEIDFISANLILAGSSGFTKTGTGIFLLSGNAAHTISGTVLVNAGTFSLTDGRIQNISQIDVANGAGLVLNVPTGATIKDRLNDSLTVNLTSGGLFSFGGGYTETVGVVNVKNFVRLTGNTTTNGALSIGTFNRQTDRTVVQFGNLESANNKITIRTAGKPTTDVTLPWAYNLNGVTARFVKYDSATDKFMQVADTLAPAAVNTWTAQGYTTSTDLYYIWTNTAPLSSALSGDLALSTLSIGPTGTTQGNNTLNLGGNTLTVKALALGSTGGSPGSAMFVTNGFVTAPAGTEQLYLHAVGAQASTFGAAIGKTGAADLTYDVIIATYGLGLKMNAESNSAYVGTMYVNNGPVSFEGAGQKVTGDLVLEEGAILTYGSSVGNQIGDTGIVTIKDGATFSFVGAAGSGLGDETVGGVQGSATASLVIGAGVAAARRFTVNTVDTNLTFAGSISGMVGLAGGASEGYLRKQGSGTWKLTGNNTYDAKTYVAGGTLLVSGTHTNLTRSSGYQIDSGGTLGGNGIIALANTNNAGNGAFVTLNAGGKLSPGESVGTLTFDLSSGGVLNITNGIKAVTGGLVFDLGGVSSSDKIVLKAGTLDIGTGLLELDDFSFTTVSGWGEQGTYVLIDTPNSLSGTLGANVTANINGMDATLKIQNNDIVLEVIPEPATWVLVLSGLVGGFCLQRRRR